MLEAGFNAAVLGGMEKTGSVMWKSTDTVTRPLGKK